MSDAAHGRAPDGWPIGPFSPPVRVLEDRPGVRFICPVSGQTIAWAAKDLFNAGAAVHDGRICLLVRAEDAVGRYAGTSRIGLAVSADGRSFVLDPEPVIAPGDDAWQAWEWPGGCEDPRVVESPDGGFVCTYTAFDGKVGCLFVATSPDLRRWTKHAPPFAYQPGQLLFDAADPTAVIARPPAPFLRIDPAEAAGQVGNVCFAQGLVAFEGRWRLYVGLADSRLGVSVAPIAT